MNKSLKVIFFYGVKSRIVYIDGENVGDMVDDVGMAMEVLFKKAITGEYPNLEFFMISVYENNLDSILNEYQYEVVMDWLSSADEISEEQQIFIINQEWDKLYRTIEKDEDMLND